MPKKPPTDPFKAQAARLRSFLKEGDIDLKQTNALEAVARMHGSPNYNTLKSQSAPVGGRQDAGSAFLARAVERALRETTLAAIPDVFEAAANIGEIFKDLRDTDYLVLADDEIAIFAAQLAANPYHLPALLASIPYLPPSENSEDCGAYSSHEGWYRRFSAHCEHVEAQLVKIVDDDTRLEMITAALPVEMRFYSQYGIALATMERKDYIGMAAALEAATEIAESLKDFDLSRSTAETAVAAWLAAGEPSRARALCSRSGHASNEAFPAIVDMIDTLTGLDEHRDLDLECWDGPSIPKYTVMSYVTALMRSPSEPTVFRYVLNDDDESPIVDVINADIYAALATAFRANQSARAWLLKEVDAQEERKGRALH